MCHVSTSASLIGILVWAAASLRTHCGPGVTLELRASERKGELLQYQLNMLRGSPIDPEWVRSSCPCLDVTAVQRTVWGATLVCTLDLSTLPSHVRPGLFVRVAGKERFVPLPEWSP